MPRVLIPSDNRDFVAELARAYRRLGWDVAVGAGNFDLRAAHYDLVHFQWPEELCGWNPPSNARLDEIGATLAAWAAETRLLLTVHNLRPHRQGGDPAYQRLLEIFYCHVPVFAHFTETSKQLLATQFPAAAERVNVVTGFFNFDSLLPAQRDAAAARQRLGIAADEFVVLIFGGLREWREVELVRDAFAGARLEKKRLLMCGRYHEFGPVWRQRWRRFSWRRWLRSSRAVVVEEFVPDAEVHRLIDASDAVVVPRFDALNSGLPALAATFGKTIVAPKCGAFPELLSGTSNPLYIAGDAADLARAVEAAAASNRDDGAQQNRALADTWSWEKIVRIGVAAAGLQPAE